MQVIHLRRFVLAVLLLILSGTTAVLAAEREIRLREYINHSWSNELVTYAVQFKGGTCHKSSLALIGPDGPVPFQLSMVQEDERGFVTAAQLSFIVDLPALGEIIYSLRYGPTPKEVSLASPTDLVITEGDARYIELVTARAGVRMLSGKEVFPAPRSAGEVPGPVAALRILDGKWIGASRLYGERQISGYEAQVEARGPVFAQVRVTYHFMDGKPLVVTVRVVASQEVVFFHSESLMHAPTDGWGLSLSRGFETPMLSVIAEYENPWGLKSAEVGHVKLANVSPGVVYNLVPWEDWWLSTTRTAFALSSPKSETVLAMGSFDPAAWRDPTQKEALGLTYEAFMTFKYMPLVKGRDGGVFLECPSDIGARKWYIGFLPKRANLDDSCQEARALHDGKYGCQTLDMVKEYVLDWEEADQTEHPCLYIPREDRPEARKKVSENVKVLEESFHRYYRTDNNERWHISGRDLIQHMVNSQYWAPRYLETFEANTNRFDLMRHSSLVVNLYDLLMGAGDLTDSERRRVRAQIAFLGYTLNSPYTWDIDRAYTGDVNNMHISYMCNLGLVACALRNHPMAEKWAAKAVRWVNIRLEEGVGNNGVWLRENTHYAAVSLSSILGFAIAAQNAGFHDFLTRGKLRDMALYLVKQLTPCDPRYQVRALPPEQVVDRAERTGLSGVLAKATVRIDPEYSQVMQWAWNQQGNPSDMPTPFIRGFEDVLMDRTLPATIPLWHSEVFPQASVILRHGIGTPDEYYMAMATKQFGDYYLSQPGAVTIYAKGKPVAMTFSGSYQVCTSESFLTNGVSPARVPGSLEERAQNRGWFEDGQIGAFSTTQQLDYVSVTFRLQGQRPVRSGYREKLPNLPKQWVGILKPSGGAPVTWKRQVLFVKDPHADEPSYFVFRDTVKGGEPTTWSMWTLSRKLGTIGETANRKAVLADAPGDRVISARELKGSRFTAIGQFDVDVEYYVALPAETPRHTLRWGYDTTGQWPDPWHEYQDMLHLQRVDDGAYFVAFYPRRSDEPSPEFVTLANGLIIKMHSAFGTDYCFLNVIPVTASSEGIHFQGVAGTVQDRKDCLVLALGARGEVAYKDYGLAADDAASVTIIGDKVMVAASHAHEGKLTVTLKLPPGTTIPGTPEAGQSAGGVLRLTLPDGVSERAFFLNREGDNIR